MYFSLISAVSKNLVIGKDNKLPWHFKTDMLFFKETTAGKTVVMGRKTFESIGSKPLPKRLNIVISSSPKPDEIDDSVIWLNDPTNLNPVFFPQLQDQEVFIVGGSSLYEYFLDKAKYLYLTMIDIEVIGDALFPEYKDVFTQVIKENKLEEKSTMLTFYKLQNPKLVK